MWLGAFRENNSQWLMVSKRIRDSTCLWDSDRSDPCIVDMCGRVQLSPGLLSLDSKMHWDPGYIKEKRLESCGKRYESFPELQWGPEVISILSMFLIILIIYHYNYILITHLLSETLENMSWWPGSHWPTALTLGSRAHNWCSQAFVEKQEGEKEERKDFNDRILINGKIWRFSKYCFKVYNFKDWTDIEWNLFSVILYFFHL